MCHLFVLSVLLFLWADFGIDLFFFLVPLGTVEAVYLRSFLQALIVVNYPLSIAFVVSHRFLVCLVPIFIHFKKTLNFLRNFFLYLLVVMGTQCLISRYLHNFQSFTCY